jgi:hypothetical protein
VSAYLPAKSVESVVKFSLTRTVVYVEHTFFRSFHSDPLTGKCNIRHAMLHCKQIGMYELFTERTK